MKVLFFYDLQKVRLLESWDQPQLFYKVACLLFSCTYIRESYMLKIIQLWLKWNRKYVLF